MANQTPGVRGLGAKLARRGALTSRERAGWRSSAFFRVEWDDRDASKSANAGPRTEGN